MRLFVNYMWTFSEKNQESLIKNLLKQTFEVNDCLIKITLFIIFIINFFLYEKIQVVENSSFGHLICLVGFEQGSLIAIFSENVNFWRDELIIIYMLLKNYINEILIWTKYIYIDASRRPQDVFFLLNRRGRWRGIHTKWGL